MELCLLAKRGMGLSNMDVMNNVVRIGENIHEKNVLDQILQRQLKKLVLLFSFELQAARISPPPPFG